MALIGIPMPKAWTGEPKANRLHCDQFDTMGNMGHARNTEGAKEARKEHQSGTGGRKSHWEGQGSIQARKGSRARKKPSRRSHHIQQPPCYCHLYTDSRGGEPKANT